MTAPSAFAPATRDAINAGVDSFRSAWVGFLNSRPDVFRTPSVVANADIPDGSGHQVFVTAGATFDLLTHSPVIPYLTAGGGLLMNRGSDAEVAIVGRYRSHFPSGSIFDEETDAVRIRYSTPDRQALWLFGGGVKGNVSPAWGWRFDVRMHVSSNETKVTLDAEPARFLAPIGAAFATATNPALQVSSLSSVSPTLSAQPVIDFATFTGSGRELQTSFTAGVVLRFGGR
jgi:hypothetical protein